VRGVPSSVFGRPLLGDTDFSLAPLARQSGPSLFSLSDRTIIVTGGARGLGLTIAHALVQSGADVHCLDILPEPVEPQWSEVKSEAESLGSKISYGQLNVTSPEDVYSTIGSIFQNARSTHPVRGLYHAAGINLLAPVEDIDIESFRRVIDINLVGSHLVSQAFAKEYFKRHEDAPPTSTMDTGVTKAGEGASIVLTASMSGTVANFGLDNAVYNSSKAGVIQLARNYAYEWSKRGIRVNVSRKQGYVWEIC
jgi:NAD(P)-dependent dehydrogenase (short-subunit alcohol dehydrogenase family)